MRRTPTIVAAAALAAGAGGLAVAGGDAPPAPAVRPLEAPAPPDEPRRRGAWEDCATGSGATFPDGFTNPRNLVVGPFSLVGGGAYTNPATVREFGGNKFAVIVRAGHTVNVRLGRRAPRSAGLAYGPIPDGEITLDETYRSVTFMACRAGERPGSGGGGHVTVWMGFVLTRRPACIPLDVRVAADRAPRRVGLALGRRCR